MFRYNFKSLDKSIKQLNNLNIKLTKSQIVNIQGSNDPWHVSGLIKNTEYGVNIILIEGQ